MSDEIILIAHERLTLRQHLNRTPRPVYGTPLEGLLKQIDVDLFHCSPSEKDERGHARTVVMQAIRDERREQRS